VRENETIKKAVEEGNWDRAVNYVKSDVLNRPEQYYTLEKLRRAANVDRRLTLRELLEKALGLIPRFKSKDELLDEEFAKFVADYKPGEAEAIPAIRHYFKAYVSDDHTRGIIEKKQIVDLYTNSSFSMADYKAVPLRYRAIIPEYVKDYVPLNLFAA
jgi:type I restriction enzyme R subunit